MSEFGIVRMITTTRSKTNTGSSNVFGATNTINPNMKNV
jgi:hypothetical protein